MPKTAIKAIWKLRPLANQTGAAMPHEYAKTVEYMLSLIHIHLR